MHSPHDPYVRVRGAREHNLKGVDVDVPRDVLVVFTGVSGSGKSSLAFGTIYAEAQRRYFESVAPYARRLIHQVGAPKVGEISGLPPAVSLQQRRSAPDVSLVGGHGHQSLQLAADAVLARGRLSAGRRAAGLGLLLAEHRGRGLPGVPRSRPGAPYDRGVAGPRPVAVDPGGRDRRVAGRLAGQEPARRPRHARVRRGPAVARAARRAARVDPVHGRAAGRHRASGTGGGPDPTPLPGHVHERSALCHEDVLGLQEPDAAGEGRAVPRRPRPVRCAAAAGCGPRHWR